MLLVLLLLLSPQLLGAFVCGIFRATGVTRVRRRPIFATVHYVARNGRTQFGWPMQQEQHKQKITKAK